MEPTPTGLAGCVPGCRHRIRRKRTAPMPMRRTGISFSSFSPEGGNQSTTTRIGIGGRQKTPSVVEFTGISVGFQVAEIAGYGRGSSCSMAASSSSGGSPSPNSRSRFSVIVSCVVGRPQVPSSAPTGGSACFSSCWSATRISTGCGSSPRQSCPHPLGRHARRGRQPLPQLTVEDVQQPLPVRAARRYPVELLLEARREPVVEQLGEGPSERNRLPWWASATVRGLAGQVRRWAKVSEAGPRSRRGDCGGVDRRYG